MASLAHLVEHMMVHNITTLDADSCVSLSGDGVFGVFNRAVYLRLAHNAAFRKNSSSGIDYSFIHKCLSKTIHPSQVPPATRAVWMKLMFATEHNILMKHTHPDRKIQEYLDDVMQAMMPRESHLDRAVIHLQRNPLKRTSSSSSSGSKSSASSLSSGVLRPLGRRFTLSKSGVGGGSADELERNAGLDAAPVRPGQSSADEFAPVMPPQDLDSISIAEISDRGPEMTTGDAPFSLAPMVGHRDSFPDLEVTGMQRKDTNNKRTWTQVEEETLKSAVAEYGTGKWRRIKADPKYQDSLTTRSCEDLRNKWRNICRLQIQQPNEGRG